MNKSCPFPIPATEELRQAINKLDLTMPLAKVMDTTEGYGWSADVARRIECDYKRFLFLTVTSTTPIVPTKNIDKLWHAHILDTQKYAHDCEVLFGAFLHHFPYFGLRGDRDRANLSAAFSTTSRAWRDTFGDELRTTTSGLCTGACSGNGGCSNCGSNGCNSEIESDGIRSGTEEFRLVFASNLPPALPM